MTAPSKVAVTRYAWDGTDGRLYKTMLEAIGNQPEWPDPDLVKVLVIDADTEDAKIVFSVVIDKEVWS